MKSQAYVKSYINLRLSINFEPVEVKRKGRKKCWPAITLFEVNIDLVVPKSEDNKGLTL